MIAAKAVKTTHLIASSYFHINKKSTKAFTDILSLWSFSRLWQSSHEMDTHNGSWRRAEWTQTCTHNDNDSESKLLSQHGFITTSPFWTPGVMKCHQLQFFQFSLPCIIHPSVQKSLFVSGDSGVCLSVSQHHHRCVSMNCSTKCSQTSNQCLHNHLPLYYWFMIWMQFTHLCTCTKLVKMHHVCITMSHLYEKNPLWRICPFNFKPTTIQRHQTGNINQQQMETSS